jgi:hypothetical protein
MNKAEAKEKVAVKIQELMKLAQDQGELLLKQSELIAKQEESLKAVSEALIHASETNSLYAHKIAELQMDHQLVTRLRPVNSWSN